MFEKLEISCLSSLDLGEFPIENTGRGEDQSPEFFLKNLSSQAKSLAITLEDLSHPLKKDFTHWVIWNIPAQTRIPAGIAAGYKVDNLGQARQGIAYGLHQYAGPKPPFNQTHDYRFRIYALDSMLNLNQWTGKKQLLKAADGHILQMGEITASFGGGREYTFGPT